MVKYFYELEFMYIDVKGDNHYFHIGYFSTMQKVRDAIESVKDKPGFIDSGGHFETTKFAVVFDGEIDRKSGIVLYEASHEYLDAEGYDNFVIFGVYATRQEAENAKTYHAMLHPYSDYPDEFCISECKVDMLGWTEGFVPW